MVDRAAGVVDAEGMRAVTGIGAAALAFGMFATMDVLVKWLADGYSLVQIVFFVNLVALLPLAALIARAGGLAAVRSRRPGLQVVRGLLSVATAFSYFFAFSRMPLADAYAIGFTSPLLITALSVPLAGEKVGWRRWTAVAVGFVGVLIMLRPGGGMLQIGALGAIAGATCYSVSMLLVRRMGVAEGPLATMTYGLGIALLVTGALLPFGYFRMPGAEDLILLTGAGLLNGLAVICLIQAFRLAPAAVVAPFQYTQMGWAVAYGYLVWGDVPDRWMLVGVSIVVASGLYVLYREARLRPARSVRVTP